MFSTRAPNRHRQSVPLAALCTAIMLMAACGGSDEVQAESFDAASVSSQPPASDESPNTTGAASEGSPLLELLGLPQDDDQAVDDYYNERYVQAEAMIAECMAALGFPYSPFDYSQLDDSAGALSNVDREYAEEFGFGIATLDEPSTDSQLVDPNAEYHETLSRGEREAFSTALYGPRDDSTDRPTGCQQDAFDAAFATFTVLIDEFGYNFEEVDELIDADPRIVEAGAQWSSCMAAAGHAYADQASAEADFVDRLGDLLGDRGAFDGDTLRPEAQGRIDNLAAEERAAATAAWDCDTTRRELEQTIAREYDQRFVDEYGPAIKEALAS